MAGRCKLHPGRPGVIQINGRSYCQQCSDNIKKAAKKVKKHVTPKDCFVWYKGGDNWTPIYGTGCAHWVTHEKGVKSGGHMLSCLKGYRTRVKDLVHNGRTFTDIGKVKIGDIFFTLNEGHCGIVEKIVDNKKSGTRRILIKHCSSGRGRVATDWFHIRFHGKGKFQRGL